MIRLSLFSASTAVMYGLCTAAPHLCPGVNISPAAVCNKKAHQTQTTHTRKTLNPEDLRSPKNGTVRKSHKTRTLRTLQKNRGVGTQRTLPPNL